jgi:hypothetical protein
VEATETRFHAERYHGDLSPILGGVLPPSNCRVRLPNRGGDIQLMSMQLVPQLDRTTLTLGKINTVDLQREPSAHHPWREDQVGKANSVIRMQVRGEHADASASDSGGDA